MDVPEIGFKKILYTTALSERGRYAFAYAASLAHQYNADLTVFHVVEEGPELDKSLTGYMDEELWEEIKQRDLDEARRILIDRKRDNVAIRECIEAYCEEIRQSHPNQPYVTYDIVVALGNPVEEIIKEVQRGSYDLVVICNLGHSSLKDAVMGSTVSRVLRRANMPVLVVRAPQ